MHAKHAGTYAKRYGMHFLEFDIKYLVTIENTSVKTTSMNLVGLRLVRDVQKQIANASIPYHPGQLSRNKQCRCMGATTYL